jgi:hypothetical protein
LFGVASVTILLGVLGVLGVLWVVGVLGDLMPRDSRETFVTRWLALSRR